MLLLNSKFREVKEETLGVGVMVIVVGVQEQTATSTEAQVGTMEGMATM